MITTASTATTSRRSRRCKHWTVPRRSSISAPSQRTLSPTLRLGYLVVPPGLRDAFTTAKRLSDRHSPALEQDALADLIASGAYERHVRSARRRNRERRAVLLTSLSKAFGDDVTVVGADAGLHVVAWLNRVPRKYEKDLLARATAAGLGLYPVSPLYDPTTVASQPSIVGLVMGYASLGERELEQGVQRLAGVLEAFRTRAPSLPNSSKDAPRKNRNGLVQLSSRIANKAASGTSRKEAERPDLRSKRTNTLPR